MKISRHFRIYFTIILLGCAFPLRARQAKNDTLRNVIKSNPIYTITGWVPASYERFISEKTSIMLGFCYITNPPGSVTGLLGNLYPYADRKGFYLNPSIRFYLWKQPGVPGGFYAAPELGFTRQVKSVTPYIYSRTNKSITISYDPGNKITVYDYQVAATLGYQAVIGKVFVFDLYAGEGSSFISFSGNEELFFSHINKKIPKSGAKLIGGFKIGIPF